MPGRRAHLVDERAVGWRDALAVGCIGAATVWASRKGVGIHDLYPDDANRALVANAGSWSEFRATAQSEMGQAAVLALVLRSSGSVTVAQLPALLMAIVAPCLVYFVAVRLGLHRVAALGGALILACGREWSAHAAMLKANTWAGAATAGLLLLALPLVSVEPGSGVSSTRQWAWFVVVGVVASVSTVFGLLALTTVTGTIVLIELTAHHSVTTTTRWAVAAVVGGSLLWYVLVLRSSSDVSDNTAYRYFEGHRLLGSVRERVWEILRGFAPWSADYEGRAKMAGAALGLLTLAGLVSLLVRRGTQALLVMGPLVAALVLAVGHRVPIGIRFDTWFFPAMAVMCAAGLHEVCVRVPDALLTVPVAGGAAAVVMMVNGTPYPEFQPSMQPLADRLEQVPVSDCVVLDGVHLAQFAWDTKWDVSFEGQVPKETWVRVGFPGRCVSLLGYGADWTSSDVLRTPTPSAQGFWWVSPRTPQAPETFVADRTERFGGWIVTHFQSSSTRGHLQGWTYDRR